MKSVYEGGASPARWTHPGSRLRRARATASSTCAEPRPRRTAASHAVHRARCPDARSRAGWLGPTPLADSAMLVLSELLTNAGRHARVSPGREIETRFVPVQDGPRIEVHDASEMPPEEQDPDVDACEGRGLLLVRAPSDAWGFRRTQRPRQGRPGGTAARPVARER
ncbi:ATP-binding protein [Streptomyces sp. NPDC057682]|uniref:ATP-binding protein n=1 Tax=Streptomyces sp. NPDC057682 TaxID=3346210 RepID=UPI00369417F0